MIFLECRRVELDDELEDALDEAFMPTCQPLSLSVMCLYTQPIKQYGFHYFFLGEKKNADEKKWVIDNEEIITTALVGEDVFIELKLDPDESQHHFIL